MKCWFTFLLHWTVILWLLTNAEKLMHSNWCSNFVFAFSVSHVMIYYNCLCLRYIKKILRDKNVIWKSNYNIYNYWMQYYFNIKLILVNTPVVDVVWPRLRFCSSKTKTKVPRPKLQHPSQDQDQDFIFMIPIKSRFWPDISSYELIGSAYKNRAMQIATRYVILLSNAAAF